MGYIDRYNRDENTVTISRVGANAGFVSFISSKFYLNDKCFSVIPFTDVQDKISNKYLFYYLKSIEANIINLQSEGGVPTINTSKVSNLQFPIPCPDNSEKSLSIQAEIVQILDSFNELSTELSTELSAREKQYEFYRKELLAFPNNDLEE